MLRVCLSVSDALHVVISRSTYVPADGILSFFFTAEQYSTVYMYHMQVYPLSIQLSVAIPVS